jgi:hypothetical protein
MIYQLAFVLLMFFGMLYYSKGKYFSLSHRKRNFIIFVCVVMVLQSGLRNLAVGSDTYGYYIDYLEVEKNSWNLLLLKFIRYYSTGEGKDPGYPILEKICQMILPSYRCFLLLVASLFFFSIGKLLNKYTKNLNEVFIAVLVYQTLFYEFFSITGLRQTIATSLAILAVNFALKRKILPFALIIILASTIHKSVFLFGLFYVISYFKNSKKFMLGCALGFVPMIFVGKSVASIFVSHYFEDYLVFLQGNEEAGAYSFTAFISIVCFFTMIKYRTIIMQENYNYIFINALALGLLFTPFVMIDSNNMRIVQYFSIFMIIIIPKIISSLSSNNIQKRNYYTLAMVMFVVFIMIRSQPYAFAWEDMKLGDNYGMNMIINGW